MGRYTDDQVAGALAILAEQGGNIAATARVTGFPEATIRKWRDGIARVPSESVAEKKAELAELFEREARAALEQADAKREHADYRAAMTGAGIATDKMQLLRDKPTERGEHIVHVHISLAEKR